MTTNPTTRASLLLRLKDPRDHEAWLDFVSLYEPAIYRVLRRSGLQDADAVDVLQDLLLAVSRNIERWEPDSSRGSFRGWLRRVARNLVVSWVRRKKRQVPTASLDLDSLLESHPMNDAPETFEFDSEVRRSLFRKASDLVRDEVQTQTWQAFWDVTVSGHSVAQTAARLGMSAGSVRVAKCRVIARLREVVAEWEESE